jgi:hypothetical protein
MVTVEGNRVNPTKEIFFILMALTSILGFVASIPMMETQSEIMASAIFYVGILGVLYGCYWFSKDKVG